jgi:hypothetical protein
MILTMKNEEHFDGNASIRFAHTLSPEIAIPHLLLSRLALQYGFFAIHSRQVSDVFFTWAFAADLAINLFCNWFRRFVADGWYSSWTAFICWTAFI